MLPQFDRDVFDTSPDKIAKVDYLHIPDLPMLHFPQNLTQNKKYSYHVTYHVTPKSFEQLLSNQERWYFGVGQKVIGQITCGKAGNAQKMRIWDGELGKNWQCLVAFRKEIMI